MQNIAQEIRQRVRLEDILNHYGFRPNRSGYINCPFHPGDHDASLRVYKDDTWHCFGCNKGRSVIDFVMEMERVPFLEAVRIIDKEFALGLFEQKPNLRHQREWQQEKLRKEKEEQERRAKQKALIDRRRQLWQEYMALTVSDHNGAQQRAALLAEVERLDAQIGGETL